MLQGFSLKLLKHLVLDEADRLLNMVFDQEIDQILKAVPKVQSACSQSSATSAEHVFVYTCCGAHGSRM